MPYLCTSVKTNLHTLSPKNQSGFIALSNNQISLTCKISANKIESIYIYQNKIMSTASAIGENIIPEQIKLDNKSMIKYNPVHIIIVEISFPLYVCDNQTTYTQYSMVKASFI